MYEDKNPIMGVEEYTDLYDKMMMNLIMVQNKDIEYFDEINNFLKDAAQGSTIKYDESARKRVALTKFFKIHKNDIGYDGNIFLEKSGTEIWIQLQELYQEVLNEEDD